MANAANLLAMTANTVANSANFTAIAALAIASLAIGNNTPALALGIAQSAFDFANTSNMMAFFANNAANAAFTQANTARTHANAAFGVANNALPNSTATLAGSLESTGYLNAASGFYSTTAGTPARPSISWKNDIYTGLSRPSSNTLTISTAAAGRIHIDSNGYVGIGTSTPTRLLDVTGNTEQAFTGLGSISGNVLTISSVISGQINVGHYISDENLDVVGGTYVKEFWTGTGGLGTYNLTASQIISSTTLYGYNLQNSSIRLTSSDASVNVGQPIGMIEFASDDSDLTTDERARAFIYAVNEQANAGATLMFGTAVGAREAQERLRINRFGAIGLAGKNFGTTGQVLASNGSSNTVEWINNPGLGANAFTSSTIAGANTAVGAGANAFTSATIAGANTAVGAGANAFTSATIAGANTAVGAGANAFTSATIAGANTAVGAGANAFTSATIAGANTAVGAGANAFTSATIAGANTAVGAGANTVGVAAFAKANSALANTSGTTFGGVLNVSGNVHIGRTDSTVGQDVKLDINGAINASAILINGSAPVSGGNYAMQVYTSSSTWTKPAGLKAIKVTVVGGGGASGNTFTSPLNPVTWPGAGAGGTSVRYIDAGTIPGPVAVTVGAGGITTNPAALSGNTSSFGAFCSATGGTTGRAAPSAGAAGGAGSGGTYNIPGQPGRITTRSSGTVIVPAPSPTPDPGPGLSPRPLVTGVSGEGGSSLFGHGGSGSTRTDVGTGSNPNPDFGINASSGTGYGAGASGQFGEGSSTATAANGTSGIVIVEEFY